MSLQCEKCNKEYKRQHFYLKHIETCQKNEASETSDIPSSSLSEKKEMGQFYTTNYDYILQNFYIPKKEKNIIEPFVGCGHLLKFLERVNPEESFRQTRTYSQYTIEAYDLKPGKTTCKLDIIIRDTLNNPPSYKNKFILTNPPYLARNKTETKELFDKYDTNDLYKCFIKQIIKDPANGGIIIIPLNFWCSIRKSDIELRKNFLSVYNIIKINIFEEKVFDDTSYAICSFLFILKNEPQLHPINVIIYPNKKEFNINLNEENNYTFGGDIYNLPQSKSIIVERLTKDNIDDNSEFITNILVKCIDDNIKSKICLNIVDDANRYIDNTPKLSARSYATLIIKPKLSLDKQQKLVELFNTFLNNKRDEYNSLFLTNYRENNTIARKRISFSLVFEIVNYILKSNDFF